MKGEKPFVIDVDAHYYENPRAFAQYLDEPWRRIISGWSGSHVIPPSPAAVEDWRSQGRIKHEGLKGIKERLTTRQEISDAMRYLGVDVCVLLPGSMLHVSRMKDRDAAIALTEGYLDHMLECVVDPGTGIYTLVVIPERDPEEAAALIRRAASHDGVCGVVVTPANLRFPLGDRFYDPIYEACQECDLPFVFHSLSAGLSDNDRLFGTTVGQPLVFKVQAMFAVQDLVLMGVPVRFPRLKIVIEEAGLFFIPLIMYHMDHAYSRLRSHLSWLEKAPSEYVKSFFFATQPLELAPQGHIASIIKMIGTNALVYASDWPHDDWDAVQAIEGLTALSELERRQILGENALRAFRFNGLAHRPVGSGSVSSTHPQL